MTHTYERELEELKGKTIERIEYATGGDIFIATSDGSTYFFSADDEGYIGLLELLD